VFDVNLITVYCSTTSKAVLYRNCMPGIGRFASANVCRRDDTADIVLIIGILT
jgi:hypothetical protein